MGYCEGFEDAATGLEYSSAGLSLEGVLSEGRG